MAGEGLGNQLAEREGLVRENPELVGEEYHPEAVGSRAVAVQNSSVVGEQTKVPE